MMSINVKVFDDFRYHLKNIEEEYSNLEHENKVLLDALRAIDIHVRSTEKPLSYIIETLKRTLPEYHE